MMILAMFHVMVFHLGEMTVPHHVIVHRGIMALARLMQIAVQITVDVINRVLSRVCTPGDWILRHVKTVSPMEMGGLIATIHQTIRWLMLRALSTMAAHVHPIQNVHFIIYVVQTVHLGIPPAVPSITVVNTPQTKRAIKRVRFLVKKVVPMQMPPVRMVRPMQRDNNIMAAAHVMVMQIHVR